jgi:hypothetical protein
MIATTIVLLLELYHLEWQQYSQALSLSELNIFP